MSDMFMAPVLSVSGNEATIEIGTGESKTANIPKNISAAAGDKALVAPVSRKYIIIQIYK